MGDYGARVSLKGYDVKTCPDRFLAWSSSFQTLKIYSSQAVTTTIPSNGIMNGNTITISHNLGYYAPFIIVYNGRTNIGVATSYFFSDSDGFSLSDPSTMCEARNGLNSLTITIYNDYNDTGLIFDNGVAGETVYFTIYLFLDDFRIVSQQNISLGSASAGLDDDYGMRVSKSGYDVKTCTDDQLEFSSSFFNQIIHKKGIDTSHVGLTTISHNLGYITSFLCWKKQTSDSYIEFMGADGDIFSINSTEATVGVNVLGTYQTDYDFYYIFFKSQL